MGLLNCVVYLLYGWEKLYIDVDPVPVVLSGEFAILFDVAVVLTGEVVIFCGELAVLTG